MHVIEEEDTCMSCEEEDTCMACEEEDTCMSCEEEDTCMSYEEEDTRMSCEEEHTCIHYTTTLNRVLFRMRHQQCPRWDPPCNNKKNVKKNKS